MSHVRETRRSVRSSRAALAAALVVIVAAVVACAAPYRPPPMSGGGTTAPAPSGSGQPQAPSAQTPAPAPSRGAPSGPIADRPITLAGSCAQTEADGYREQATLKVQDNTVQAMSWQLSVGRKGSCKFELNEFTQTKSRPHIELTARDGSGCKLVIYQETRRITMGHAQCQKRCTGNIYEEAWPVMFDPRTGGCAVTG